MENRELSRKIVIPQVIGTDREYRERLIESFNAYIEYIRVNPCFDLSSDEINDTESIYKDILRAFDSYFEGSIKKATSKMKEILRRFINSKFIVCNLDDSYAFRMVGKIDELHNNSDYSHLNDNELSFFRARVSEVPLTKRKEISHIPVCKKAFTSTERFCIAGIPCLYLCVSSFTCWKELNQPSNSNFYCSSIKFNDEGKKLKILNLTLPLGLIWGTGENSNDYGKQLQHELIKIYPFVLATSFHVEQENRKFKSEYVISQLIMHCLKELDIDGVAYMSTKVEGKMNFPLNVCLALPAFDEKSLDDKFKLTEPVLLENFINLTNRDQAQKRSFINKYYSQKNDYSIGASDVKFFNNSIYSDFDDYLVNQEHKKLMENSEDKQE